VFSPFSVYKYAEFCAFLTKLILFSEPGQNFNFAQWSSAVAQVNENMKLLLGIPASPSAGQGYEPPDNIKTIYDSIKNATNFAGETFNCDSHYQ
jgi:hypothetical protein